MMCAVFISVNFCISVANGWPGSNWRFWSLFFLMLQLQLAQFLPSLSTSYSPWSPSLCTCLVFQFLLC